MTMYVPYLSYYAARVRGSASPTRSTTGRSSSRARQPNAPLAVDQSVTFTPAFKPVKGHTYTRDGDVANEQNGHTETRTATVTA